MPGQKPKYRAIIPGSDQSKTVEIGAAWSTAKENVLSVRMKDGTSFILVPNEPRTPKQGQAKSQPQPR